MSSRWRSSSPDWAGFSPNANWAKLVQVQLPYLGQGLAWSTWALSVSEPGLGPGQAGWSAWAFRLFGQSPFCYSSSQD